MELSSLFTRLRGPLIKTKNLIYFTLNDHLIVNRLELTAISQIRTLIKHAQPYALFSGGKDSLVALNLVKHATRLTSKEPIAIHADTTAGLPGNLKYVREISRTLGVKLIVARPNPDFFTLTKRKGFPRFNARWCCYKLKVDPIKNFIRKQAGEKIVFDGIRAEESRQRANMSQLSWHKQFKCHVYHPILHWSGQDVSSYLERHRLPVNPMYSKGFERATECWCGVFKSVKEFRLLLRLYPEFFDKLVELEDSMRKGGSYLYKRGKKIYLRDLKNGEAS